MIEAGTILQERYRVEKQIGQGGMGAVFVATDERFGSTVAIKETFFTDEKFRRAFEREARLLNSLRHPALPRVSDHFIDGNGQFLVMEFIDGEDLSEQLETEAKVFAVKDVLAWADQLLDALEYLHTREMPVIHRDIKPQNLKLTSRGQIILLDFGLAKGNPTNSESGTAAKSVFGYSRNYASIEQIQGSGTDPRSDIYSLAATLYHLLTGVPPADALTRAMNVLSDREDPLIEAHRIRAEIPPGVARVLQNAMALNAEQRPATAREMRERLTAVRDETPLTAAEILNDAETGTNIYSQKTRIYSEGFQPSNLKQSDIKTETFSNEESKVTQVKEANTGDFEKREVVIEPLADNRNKKRKLAIGATFGGLLLAGSAASAVFVFQPEVFGLRENRSNESPERKIISTQIPAENTNTANTNAADTNAVTEIPANTNAATEPKPKETTAQTDAKTVEPKAKPSVNQSTKKNDTTAAIDEPPDINVDKDGDSETPANSRTKQRFPPFVWQKMTPEQRRKLRQALELERQQKEAEQRRRQNLPKPPPQPTPY